MVGGYLARHARLIQAGQLREGGGDLAREVLGHEDGRQHRLVHLGVVVRVHADLLPPQVEGKLACVG